MKWIGRGGYSPERIVSRGKVVIVLRAVLAAHVDQKLDDLRDRDSISSIHKALFSPETYNDVTP